MNSKTLKIDDILAIDPKAGTGIFQRIRGFVRNARETMAVNRCKRQLQLKSPTAEGRDALRGLPLEEKLRFGMYQYMD